MTPSEHKKALLLAKIEAHRRMLALEVRCARAMLDPWRSLLPRLVGAALDLVEGRRSGGAGQEAVHGHGAREDAPPGGAAASS